MNDETITEKWLDIPGYFGKYQVSSNGKVASLKSGHRKLLKPGVASNGYLTVALCNDGKQRTYTVHNLVANLFVKGHNKLRNIVNHIDGDKLNNRSDNLEWCTQKANIDHANNILQHFTGCRKVKVLCVETQREYSSVGDAARDLLINRHNISSVLSGNRLTAGGYHWRAI